MKNIKFRAWDLNEKKIRVMGDNYVGDFDGFWSWHSRYASELMQFTGLFDKNGKEIYEGDIVKAWVGDINKDIIREVEYLGSSFGIWDEFNVFQNLDEWADNAIEVIGNIYENPELRNGE